MNARRANKLSNSYKERHTKTVYENIMKEIKMNALCGRYSISFTITYHEDVLMHKLVMKIRSKGYVCDVSDGGQLHISWS